MNFTDENIITMAWDVARMDPKATAGKTGRQIRAFRLILVTRGGVGFIASRPNAELEKLASRGVCPANLHTILRQMADLELQGRDLRRSLARIESQLRQLICDAAQPGILCDID